MKPIFTKLSPRQVLFVGDKSPTIISLLRGIYFPPLNKQDGNFAPALN
ncbi:hypothetical protein [Lapidilactobacillus bayanensis]|nr:hypothetical protein [Lapidilactobacillus bayanensis]